MTDISVTDISVTDISVKALDSVDSITLGPERDGRWSRTPVVSDADREHHLAASSAGWSEATPNCSRSTSGATVAARRPRWTKMIMLITATHAGNRSATARTLATESINTTTNA